MHLRTALLSVLSASAILGCDGKSYVLGGASDGGGTGTTVAPDGGAILVEPDGGTIVIPPQAIVVNKVDLLFMIDNSSSMGDKQAYLVQAIPDLVARLVTPNCLGDATHQVAGPSTLDSSGNAQCTAYPGSSLEFPAVRDMHIGIVSSSLGPRLGDQSPSDGSGGECLPTAAITINGATLTNHNDDQAHLLTRSSDPTLPLTAPPTEVPLADGAAASGFLAWSPSGGTAGAETSAPQLISDFSDLVAGVHAYGCGIESQLESWYRFLVQPDPYASLALGGPKNNQAQWVGVDTTILKERHDFLRPDSLVAIVDLTDENDSEIDVRSVGGQGYLFMSTKFYPPHGTSQCAANPADPACQSCEYLLQAGGSDPACGTSASPNLYNSPTDWGYDLNLRHVHMVEKYGLDPQFPIGRYQNGLASTKVPDRTGEYPEDSSGAQAPNYVGTNDCTNPLYAASLPDGTATDAATLCNLPVGKRTPGLVYFLHIGGVPSQLLHFTPGSTTANELTSADWVKILGNDPIHYDYTGIDPHMIESVTPRPGLPGPGSAVGADPISGHEWDSTDGPHLDLNVDLEYACIFKLATPRDCSKDAQGAYTVNANEYSCDCSSTGLTPDELSPVCDPTTNTTQNYAKAYPTIRELTLAKLLGPQGIVASICPIDVADNTNGTDPLYGYRPAVSNLVDHMRPTLAFTGN
jgi:hypothetical protein